MTIPGVGPVTASALLATIQGLSGRFPAGGSSPSLPRADPARKIDRRQVAAGAHNQDGRPLSAQAWSRGRVLGPWPPQGAFRRLAPLG